MKWRQKSKWHLESDPPGYVIAKFRVVRNGEMVWVYQAVRLGSPSRVLGEAGSAEECKAVVHEARH